MQKISYMSNVELLLSFALSRKMWREVGFERLLRVLLQGCCLTQLTMQHVIRWLNNSCRILFLQFWPMVWYISFVCVNYSTDMV